MLARHRPGARSELSSAHTSSRPPAARDASHSQARHAQPLRGRSRPCRCLFAAASNPGWVAAPTTGRRRLRQVPLVGGGAFCRGARRQLQQMRAVALLPDPTPPAPAVAAAVVGARRPARRRRPPRHADGSEFPVKGISWYGMEENYAFSGLEKASLGFFLDFLRDQNFNALRAALRHQHPRRQGAVDDQSRPQRRALRAQAAGDPRPHRQRGGEAQHPGAARHAPRRRPATPTRNCGTARR